MILWNCLIKKWLDAQQTEIKWRKMFTKDFSPIARRWIGYGWEHKTMGNPKRTEMFARGGLLSTRLLGNKCFFILLLLTSQRENRTVHSKFRDWKKYPQRKQELWKCYLLWSSVKVSSFNSSAQICILTVYYLSCPFKPATRLMVSFSKFLSHKEISQCALEKHCKIV